MALVREIRIVGEAWLYTDTFSSDIYRFLGYFPWQYMYYVRDDLIQLEARTVAVSTLNP